MGLFALDTPKKDTSVKVSGFENNLEGRSDATVQKFRELHTAKVAIIEKHLKIPSPGDCWFVWTTNQFNTMAYILWIIKHLGYIRSLTITTFSIGTDAINTIMRLKDEGAIGEVFFYVCTYTRRIKPKITDLLESMAAARNGVTVEYGKNHSKVTLAETSNDFIVITGSGNFSANDYNEQYTICNDRKIYNFYYSAIRCGQQDQPE